MPIQVLLNLASPTGKSPWLEVDGHIIPESYAIHRFIANKFGFAGKDEFEKAAVDSTADFFADVMNDIRDYVLVVHGLVKGDKDQVYKEKFIPTLERAFTYIQGLIKNSGSGFVVSSGITWVDMVIAGMFCFLMELEPKVENEFPEMAAHEKRVHSHPRIKDYVDLRKDIKLSYFSK